jgi:hypothetical protein
MFSLASWVLAVAAALAFEGPATTIVETLAGLPKPVAATVGFVVTVVVVEALFSAAGYLAIRPIVALVRRSSASVAERLGPVARAHSEEMFKLKYFSHESPASGSPFD